MIVPLTESLRIQLEEVEGYYNIKEIKGRGVCALMQFAFTTGLVYSIDEGGYTGRYCFADKNEAIEALNEWNGEGHPGGMWIKHKGEGIDERNPNFSMV